MSSTDFKVQVECKYLLKAVGASKQEVFFKLLRCIQRPHPHPTPPHLFFRGRGRNIPKSPSVNLMFIFSYFRNTDLKFSLL